MQTMQSPDSQDLKPEQEKIGEKQQLSQQNSLDQEIVSPDILSASYHRNSSILNVFDFEEIENDPNTKITFSQSKKLVSIYSEAGYAIYLSEQLIKDKNAEPIIIKSKENLKYGILHFAFLYDSKIFAIVPNKKRGQFSSSRVILWDEMDEEQIAEYNFHNKIDQIIYLKDSLVINCSSKIIFFNTVKNQIYKYLTINQPPDQFNGNQNIDAFTIAFSIEFGYINYVHVKPTLNGPYLIKNPYVSLGLVE